MSTIPIHVRLGRIAREIRETAVGSSRAVMYDALATEIDAAAVEVRPSAIASPVDFCDDRHQAVAFVGTCPLCRERWARSHASGDRPPLSEGTFYVADLRRALAGLYRSPAATHAIGGRAVLDAVGLTERKE